MTPFIKENPEKFKIVLHEVEIDNPFKNLRLTIDAPEDYKLAGIIYEELYRGKPYPLNAVIEFLKENPKLVKINSNIIQRQMTQSGI